MSNPTKHLLSVLLMLLAGCVPDGQHEVCDEWSVIYNVYYFDGKTPSIIPQNYCARSHLEKDSVR